MWNFPDPQSTFQENQFHGISTRFVFFVCPLEPITKAPHRDQTYDQTEHKQDYKSFFRNKEMYNRYVGQRAGLESKVQAQYLHEAIKIDFQPKINYYSTFRRNFKSTITFALCAE